MNLNKNYDKDFKLACELFKKGFSHSELIEMLKNGNIQEKQFAALNLDCINNADEAKILVNNLIGCDGKIREAVALKINQLLTDNCEFVESLFCIHPEIFAKATIDINANICRLVINSVSALINDDNFRKEYLNNILLFIKETFEEIDKFIYKDKKYVINKQLFKLYWCLESLKLFVNYIPADILMGILERASQESEYTIREKVAQILILTNDKKYKNLIEKMRNDENYYVKAVFS